MPAITSAPAMALTMPSIQLCRKNEPSTAQNAPTSIMPSMAILKMPA